MSRYVVAYAHLDGNTYAVSRHADLEEAQAAAATVRDRFEHCLVLPQLPVVVWDEDDPERGDLSETEIEE